MTTETDGGRQRGREAERQRGRQAQDREPPTVQPEPESRVEPEAPTVQPVISTLTHMCIRPRMLQVISTTCEPCQACLLFERLYLTVTCFVLTCLVVRVLRLTCFTRDNLSQHKQYRLSEAEALEPLEHVGVVRIRVLRIIRVVRIEAIPVDPSSLPVPPLCGVLCTCSSGHILQSQGVKRRTDRR